jgi:hypothetical protein
MVGRSYDARLRVTATSELRTYAEDNGGVLYVSTHRSRCCASVAWVTASTSPLEGTDYEPTVVDGALVCIRFPAGQAPGELRLALEGKRPIASGEAARLSSDRER